LIYFQGECSELLCPDGLSLKSGPDNNYYCHPQVNFVNNKVQVDYVINYMLSLSDDAKNSNIENGIDFFAFIDAMRNEMNIKQLLSEFSIKHCNLFATTNLTFTQLLNNTDNVSNLLRFSGVIYVSLRLTLTSAHDKLVEHLERVSIVFASADHFHGVFDVKYSLASPDLDIFEPINATTDEVNLFRHWSRPYIQAALQDHAGHVIIPVTLLREPRYGNYKTSDAGTDITIWPNPTCPRLKVQQPASEYGKDVLYNASEVLHPDTTEMKGKLGEPPVFVCLYDYLKQVKINANTSTSVLPALTITCLCLSIVALLITIAIYCVLPKIGSLARLNTISLSASILFFNIMSLLSFLGVSSSSKNNCQAIGILVHSGVTLSMSWMTVCTYHFTRVINSSVQISLTANATKEFIKYSIFAVATTLIIIAGTIIHNYFSSGHDSIGYGGYPCFIIVPAFADAILYFVAFPLGFTIFFNIGCLVASMISLYRHPKLQTSHNRDNISKIKIFVKLSSITGFTWCFGYVYQLTEEVVFAYAFVVLAGCQGVFIMIAFIFNNRVWSFITEKFRLFRKQRSQSTSTSTQHNSFTSSNRI